MGGEYRLAGYASKHTTMSGLDRVASYTCRRALRCKTVEEGAEATDVVAAGALVEAGSTSSCSSL